MAQEQMIRRIFQLHTRSIDLRNALREAEQAMAGEVQKLATAGNIPEYVVTEHEGKHYILHFDVDNGKLVSVVSAQII